MILKCERCKCQKYSIYLASRKIGVQRQNIGNICPNCWGIELNNKWEEFSNEKKKIIESMGKKKPKFYDRTKCKKCGSVRLKFIKKPTKIIQEGTRERAYNETNWYYVCRKCAYSSEKEYSTNNPK